MPSRFLHAHLRCALHAVLLGLLIAVLDAAAAEKSGFAPVLMEKASVARQLDMLRAICEPDQVSLRDGVPTCAACPSYTSGAARGVQISNVISGNFTRPGVTQTLVDITGCEPGSGSGGGSVLLEHSAGGWKRLLYRAGLRSNECVRFRNIKQTLSLACNQHSVEDGIQHGKLMWLTLHAGKPVQHELLAWCDNSRGNPKRLLSVFPHRFMKSDFNADGRVDLQVSLRIRDETVPAQYSGLSDAVAGGYRLKEPQPLRLVFLFDGTSLVLSPDSEAGKARVDALLEAARTEHD
jgi:hypothetical protein